MKILSKLICTSSHQSIPSKTPKNHLRLSSPSSSIVDSRIQARILTVTVLAQASSSEKILAWLSAEALHISLQLAPVLSFHIPCSLFPLLFSLAWNKLH
ncbi:hypothetical protein AVEN_241408-1 [Araneus ventricosus]|uniref:Uncharacterized protein n=1 Tax=Araneus ventricosus TaxID=182803 RepID=A0A4Y2M4Y5_ARAVE|nr:hypothetical protein AVEN_241408-1 [Araneus ventricosus]